MKRALFSLLVISLAVAWFAGYWAAGAEVVQWAVYGSQIHFDHYDRLAARFMEIHPDIKVEILQIGNVDERIQLLIAGGSAPDVVIVNNHNSLGVLWAGGYADISDKINNDPTYKKADYFPNTYEPFLYKGQIWAAPVSFATIGIYYNQDRLSEKGASIPVNWTWNDFKQVNQRLATDQNGDGTPEIYGTMFNASSPTRMFQWFYQNKAVLWNETWTRSLFNNPEAVDVLRYFKDLVDSKAISPVYTANIARDFISGNIGMISEVTGHDSNIRQNGQFKAGIAPLPAGKTRSTLIFTDGFAITSASKHKDAAWELIKFLVGEEGTQAFLDMGYIPALRKKTVSYLQAEHNLPGVQHFVDSVAYARALEYPMPVGRLNAIFYPEMGKLWKGQASPQETAIKLEETFNAELAVNK